MFPRTVSGNLFCDACVHLPCLGEEGVGRKVGEEEGQAEVPVSQLVNKVDIAQDL